MIRLFFYASALIVSALTFGPTEAYADAPSRSGSLSIETISYPAGVARPGPQVSYTAPAFRDLERGFRFDGKARSYYLYVPQGSGAAPRPVIVLLHGAQRSGRSMIDMWQALADRHDVVLLAPNSQGASWSPDADHPNFLMAALRDAHGLSPLDPRRIYLFGHSAGGILATLYANRAGTVWRAVATHAGVLDAKAIVTAESAPPMRHYLGVNDHLFSVRSAQSTAKALAEAGHDIELVTIRSHTHWYYDIGPYLSEAIWQYWQDLD